MAIQHIPDGSLVSADGRWLWRGGQWIEVPAATGQPGLFWFFNTPQWAQSILIMGLIGLIPIVGILNLYGYAIATSRNLRAGWRVLPPAGFGYLGLGAPVTVLSFAWSFIVLLLALLAGGFVWLTLFAQTHHWPLPVAIGVATGITVLGLLSAITAPVLVPALEMSGREGWRVFHVGRLVRHTLDHWRAVWYGFAVYLLWNVLYLGLGIVASAVPFGSLLAAVVALPVMAAMLAVPLARFDDPPAGFSKGAANALAAGWVAFTLLLLAIPWAVGLTAAAIINSHPEETACFFQSGCNFAYSGSLETIARVQRGAEDPTLVTVDVTFINRSARPAFIDPADYSARTTNGTDLPISSACPARTPASVAPGGRLEQRVCFQLPDARARFEVHLPWTGWDFKTS